MTGEGVVSDEGQKGQEEERRMLRTHRHELHEVWRKVNGIAVQLQRLMTDIDKRL